MAMEMGRRRRLKGETSLQKQKSRSVNLKRPAWSVNVLTSTGEHIESFFIALVLTAAFSRSLATAQENSNSNPQAAATSAVAPKVVNIWPGVAPGSEEWKQEEATQGSGSMQRIVNVTTPTRAAYLPDPANATSTAVIIAPGGGLGNRQGMAR